MRLRPLRVLLRLSLAPVWHKQNHSLYVLSHRVHGSRTSLTFAVLSLLKKATCTVEAETARIINILASVNFFTYLFIYSFILFYYFFYQNL